MELNLLQEFSLPYSILFPVVISLSSLNLSLLKCIRTVYTTQYDHYKFIENLLIQSDYSLHLDRSILNGGR